jgi:hypothetical protein
MFFIIGMLSPNGIIIIVLTEEEPMQMPSLSSSLFGPLLVKGESTSSYAHAGIIRLFIPSRTMYSSDVYQSFSVPIQN